MTHPQTPIQIAAAIAEALQADGYDVVEEGEYPVEAVRWGGNHPVMIFHYGTAYTVALPTRHSFHFLETDDPTLKMKEIAETVKTYRETHPSIMSFADVVLRLRPVLPTSDGVWVVNFSGTAVPAEAWMKNDSNSIGLFQEGESARVVVWVGSDMRFLIVDSPEKLHHLSEWILPHLDAQKKTNAREADEQRKREEIEPPSIEKVMEALNGGLRLQLGVGRAYSTYYIQDGKLRREVFDEGMTYDAEGTVEELAESLKWNAEYAQKQLSRR